MQNEYSLWARDVEQVTPVLAEFGVGLVPYGPLGRGFLTGRVEMDKLDAEDLRRKINPRFTGEAAVANQAIVDSVSAIARRNNVPASHIALAWIYAQSKRLNVNIVPIPGTKCVKWLNENVAALAAQLTPDDLNNLDTLATRASGQYAVAANTLKATGVG
jgi:aryl-alcohol dehydrogenase-like predicted oxidoreductase